MCSLHWPWGCLVQRPKCWKVAACAQFGICSLSLSLVFSKASHHGAHHTHRLFPCPFRAWCCSSGPTPSQTAFLSTGPKCKMQLVHFWVLVMVIRGVTARRDPFPPLLHRNFDAGQPTSYGSQSLTHDGHCQVCQKHCAEQAGWHRMALPGTVSRRYFQAPFSCCALTPWQPAQHPDLCQEHRLLSPASLCVSSPAKSKS